LFVCFIKLAFNSLLFELRKKYRCGGNKPPNQDHERLGHEAAYCAEAAT